jgi:hypothetical protein
MKTEMREEPRELSEGEMRRQRGVIAELNASDAGSDMATIGGERYPRRDTHLAVPNPSSHQGKGKGPVLVPGTETNATKKSERLSNLKFGSLDSSPSSQGPSLSMRGGMECDEKVSELVERVDSVRESSGDEEEDSVHGTSIKKEENHVEYKSLRDLVEASEPEYADVGKDG